MNNAFFRWMKHFFRPPKQTGLDLKRRGLIFGAAAGVGGVLLVRTGALGEGKTFSPELIRPPGSLGEDDFLSRCIRCSECMKVCPTNAIQPAVLEGGFEALWTPVLKMRLGYCEYECNLCSQVCPTQAIRRIPVEEKQKIKIGLAFFDKNRCLPYALSRTCIVCEEHCPTPRKAIWFQEVQVIGPDGNLTTVKQPHVDPEICIGCGICETKCPIADQRGVYVTSVGETRNPKNQVLLDSYAGDGGY